MFTGMEMRDYFAVHADQPGVSEIVAAAGMVHSGGRVWSNEEVDLGSFNVWWDTLPLVRRLELSAMVRYAMADAMLRVRQM